MPTNGELAREYIRAIENGATGEELARFFTQDVAIKEMPDRRPILPKPSKLPSAVSNFLCARLTRSLIFFARATGLHWRWIGLALRPCQFKTCQLGVR